MGDGATPTEVFTLIPGVRTINGPDMSAEQIDVTSHDTPGGFRTKIQGLKDWGVLSFEMLWDPNDAKHLALFNDYISGDGAALQADLPDDAGRRACCSPGSWAATPRWRRSTGRSRRRPRSS